GSVRQHRGGCAPRRPLTAEHRPHGTSISRRQRTSTHIRTSAPHEGVCAMPTGHVPVLLERCLELLGPALSAPVGRDAVYVDATLGLGGHAGAVLASHPRLVLIGLDRDTEALGLAGERLAAYAGRTHLVHAVYDELPEVLA